MKKLFALTALALAVAVAAHAGDGNGRDHDDDDDRSNKIKPPFTVKFIGLNDYHGNLESPGTFGVNTSVPSVQQLHAKAEERLPGNPLPVDVKGQLPSKQQATLQEKLADATPMLQAVPLRFLPYGAPGKLPENASVAGSGILIGEGRQALVPLDVVEGRTTVWVRNGLGQLSRANVEGLFAGDRLALLALDTPLPAAAEVMSAARDLFPGSIGYVVEYAASSKPHPAWPVLTAGFPGSPIGAGQERKPGIELHKGPRGSAVFDAAGHFAGIAMAGETGPDKLIPVSRLREHVGKALGAEPAASAQSFSNTGNRASAGVVYKSAMRMCLQVLTVR